MATGQGLDATAASQQAPAWPMATGQAVVASGHALLVASGQACWPGPRVQVAVRRWPRDADNGRGSRTRCFLAGAQPHALGRLRTVSLEALPGQAARRLQA